MSNGTFAYFVAQANLSSEIASFTGGTAKERPTDFSAIFIGGLIFSDPPWALEGCDEGTLQG